MRVMPILIAAALAFPASAAPDPAFMPGVWSIGETPNCATGGAWVFLADGYYAEVKLPDGQPTALGLWRDEGGALAYTHSHLPFPDMMKINAMSRMTIEARNADKLLMRNARGVPRIFHRCPASSLKAQPGGAAH